MYFHDALCVILSTRKQVVTWLTSLVLLDSDQWFLLRNHFYDADGLPRPEMYIISKVT